MKHRHLLLSIAMVSALAASAHAATILNSTTFTLAEVKTDGNIIPGMADSGVTTNYDTVNGWTWGTGDSSVTGGVFAGLSPTVGDREIRQGDELITASGNSHFYFGYGGSGIGNVLAQKFNGVGIGQTVTLNFALSSTNGMKLFVDNGSGVYADTSDVDGTYIFNTTGAGNIRIALSANNGADSNTNLFDIQVSSVPEPSAALLGGLGLLALLRRRR